MSLGIICRVDSGGLGIQARWVMELTNPDAVVAVDLGKGNRGPVHHIDHPNVLHAEWGPQGSQDFRKVAAHLSGCDVVWSAESLYWQSMSRRLRRVCIHINQELWVPHARDRTVFPALPTDWLAEGSAYPVVQHPSPVGDPKFAEIAAENLARTGPARRILHMAAPAMLDRNGSQAVLAALGKYRGPAFTLVVGGSRFEPNPRAKARGLDSHCDWPDKVGNVRVEVLPAVPDHRDLYRNVDLMVLPRRYAGQCLPAQEAAAAGVPVLMTDVAPQDRWAGVAASVRCSGSKPFQMRGGRFDVWQPDPASIAEALMRYTGSDGVRRMWQRRAQEWAWSQRWDAVKPAWDRWLFPSHR